MHYDLCGHNFRTDSGPHNKIERNHGEIIEGVSFAQKRFDQLGPPNVPSERNYFEIYENFLIQTCNKIMLHKLGMHAAMFIGRSYKMKSLPYISQFFARRYCQMY